MGNPRLQQYQQDQRNPGFRTQERQGCQQDHQGNYLQGASEALPGIHQCSLGPPLQSTSTLLRKSSAEQPSGSATATARCPASTACSKTSTGQRYKQEGRGQGSRPSTRSTTACHASTRSTCPLLVDPKGQREEPRPILWRMTSHTAGPHTGR